MPTYGAETLLNAKNCKGFDLKKDNKVKYMKKIWGNIDWPKIELKVYDLQKKIFVFSDKEKLLDSKIQTRKLQKLLVKSEEAKLLAVRKMTQDNRLKRHDGEITISPGKRIDLLPSLRLDGKVYLSKDDTLGNAAIKDNIKQTLVLMALEPEWEALFEHNSYGYRPCYSYRDAKWAATRQLQGAPKFVLNGRVLESFGEIDHSYLMHKLNQSRMFSNQIESWLKAGILSEKIIPQEEFPKNLESSNGVLFPLFVNIILHGMEASITEKLKNKVKMIRYFNNFLIFGTKLEDVNFSFRLIKEFLEPIGLKLSQDTVIVHSMEKFDNQFPGFKFLNFHFVNTKCSKNRGVKSTHGVKQCFIQQTIPSREAVKKHKRVLNALLVKYKNAPLKAVVEKLSFHIKIWTNYFSTCQATHTFTQLDGWLWKKLWKWSVKRYKGAATAKLKCWSVSGWKFGFIKKNQTFILKRHDQNRIKKHVKIKAGASIYNGEVEYFAKRVSLSDSRVLRLNGLFKKQNYKCAICMNFLKPNDIIEIHHSINDLGVRTDKIQFVHGYCHDLIHKKF
jgi:RNA-directed DNA polymerase